METMKKALMKILELALAILAAILLQNDMLILAAPCLVVGFITVCCDEAIFGKPEEENHQIK